ncbi:MAG: UDP-N-acetylmuramoyl-L-alanyl-D-glutamate--2,6-diaminopimelate ligase [Gemmatimonas sp.]|nr:UDP-N-acetylmuramoyl-L-alanyl-D-glutamate--2,6-diaminopimelate ligase [Gemmatimonas sp.]
MVTLAQLLAVFPQLAADAALPAAPIPVDAIAVDSRRCAPGVLFVAVRGAAADGHAHLAAAAAAGCAAVLIEADAPAPAGVPVLRAAGTRPWPARLAREIAGRPDAELCAVGVTGTNGKTTTAFLLRRLLERCAGPCGLLGTILYETGSRPVPAPLTTPDGPTLYGLLAEMRAHGRRAVALEVSSHALDQGRTADLALDAAVMTNLSRDHLDYHADLDDYLRAKARILELLRGDRRGKPPGVAVLNADEAAFDGLDTGGLRVVRYAAGRRPGASADLSVQAADLSRGGTRLRLDWRGERLDLESRLVGRFNVENLTAALAAGLALGFAPSDCLDALAAAEQVPGRMESFDLPSGATAVVDYAHTPDALAAVLQSCRELTPRRLVTVFGCGGDRDRGKRPLMGAVAARLADATWITSDNPRGEEPVSICDQIADGFRAETSRRSTACRLEPDRAAAIRGALAEAGDGDTVVIAGKGHEDYQLVGDRRLDLDDRRLVRDWIAEVARDV